MLLLFMLLSFGQYTFFPLDLFFCPVCIFSLIIRIKRLKCVTIKCFIDVIWRLKPAIFTYLYVYLQFIRLIFAKLITIFNSLLQMCVFFCFFAYTNCMNSLPVCFQFNQHACIPPNHYTYVDILCTRIVYVCLVCYTFKTINIGMAEYNFITNEETKH